MWRCGVGCRRVEERGKELARCDDVASWPSFLFFCCYEQLLCVMAVVAAVIAVAGAVVAVVVVDCSEHDDGETILVEA